MIHGKFLTLLSCGSDVQNWSHWAKVNVLAGLFSGGPGQWRGAGLLYSSTGDLLHSMVYGLFLTSLQLLLLTSPSTHSAFLPCSYKNLYSDISPIQITQNKLRTLNLLLSRQSPLPYKLASTGSGDSDVDNFSSLVM
jgi:hypothetical protein